ncbi:MAG: 2-polyprenyl-6-methoxyphenol hydroxylase-like FAD-dependent oxidoreductase [Salibacteraceae bacterium]|jgi:2-polyprenyl-6-methoxyphenol hydroxylase-like FAD-dependent oxidoreductase
MLGLKVVIIGGSVAGLGLAIALKKANKEVVIREKNSINAKPGLAFMIHSKTLKDIQSITETPLDVSQATIDKFILVNGSGDQPQKMVLSEWYVLKRITLLKFFRDHLSDDEYVENSDFSHFKYTGDTATAAVFKDGSIEYGDLFIGADGINSQVRQFVCKAHFFPNEINELVCIIKHNEKFAQDQTFRKYHIKKGMSFGFIPISDNEHVWFFQFDSKLYNHLFIKNKGTVNGFESELLSEFPKDVREIIANSDTQKAHLWINQELKLLSSYYAANVCLIGDAAHGSISLTSSGVSSGISSAIKLAEVLSYSNSLETALAKYNTFRKKENAEKIEYAKVLKDQFNSRPVRIEDYSLPLFS